MEEHESKMTPLKPLLMMYSARAGVILSNAAVVLTVLSLFTLTAMLVSALIWILGFFFIILSFGMIFVVAPNFWDSLTSGAEFIQGIGEFFLRAAPVLAPTAIVCAAMSIVFLLLDRRERHTGRIVFSALLLVGALVILILLHTGTRG